MSDERTSKPTANQQLSELYDKVDLAMSELSYAQRAYLRAAGWTYSSSHPDSCWRWSKDFGGKQYTFVDPHDAIDFDFELRTHDE